MRAEFSFVKEFLVPVTESPVLSVVHYLDDGGTLEQYPDADSPLNAGGCSATSTVTDGVVEIQLIVPFSAFMLDPISPRQDDTLRFNAALVHDSGESAGATVVHWGFPKSDVSRHGALVRFVE